uniref:(northern house mosquito) hypothetical protein n=1 Tax=Culex pipiens TaxID=7175 RepID=A0A8D8IYZ0_CULPI
MLQKLFLFPDKKRKPLALILEKTCISRPFRPDFSWFSRPSLTNTSTLLPSAISHPLLPAAPPRRAAASWLATPRPTNSARSRYRQTSGPRRQFLRAATSRRPHRGLVSAASRRTRLTRVRAELFRFRR